MISIIIRIARIYNTISISIRINQTWINLFNRDNFSIKFKDFFTCRINFYRFFCIRNRNIRIACSGIDICNLNFINTISISIIWVIRIRHIDKCQVPFPYIFIFSIKIRERIFLLCLSSWLTTHNLYFTCIRSANYFFTHLPFAYIT